MYFFGEIIWYTINSYEIHNAIIIYAMSLQYNIISYDNVVVVITNFPA